MLSAASIILFILALHEKFVSSPVMINEAKILHNGAYLLLLLRCPYCLRAEGPCCVDYLKFENFTAGTDLAIFLIQK
jgi:hypothetical protein